MRERKKQNKVFWFVEDAAKESERDTHCKRVKSFAMSGGIYMYNFKG